MILDNHKFHLSIEALDVAKEPAVHVLTLYPHTSGKLQPLDDTGVDSWTLRNPGKSLTIYDIGEIISDAFLKVVTPINITKALKHMASSRLKEIYLKIMTFYLVLTIYMC